MLRMSWPSISTNFPTRHFTKIPIYQAARLTCPGPAIWRTTRTIMKRKEIEGRMQGGIKMNHGIRGTDRRIILARHRNSQTYHTAENHHVVERDTYPPLHPRKRTRISRNHTHNDNTSLRETEPIIMMMATILIPTAQPLEDPKCRRGEVVRIPGQGMGILKW